MICLMRGTEALILSIPLTLTNRDDTIVWLKEVSGLYLVKSAYKLIQELNGTWNSATSSTFRKKFWKLHVPPKIKDLVWRACSNCLPIMVQLRTKHATVTMECPIYHESEESIVHCLVECPAAQSCWNRVGISTGCPWLLVFPAGLRRVFSSSMMTGEIFLLPYVGQFGGPVMTSLETTLSGLTKDDGAEKWRLPPSNSIKISVDGAIFADLNRFGLGLVVRDDKRFLIEGKTKLYQENVAAEVAEAMIFREALSWVK
uniref:Reverse transcriptase zinc-binding domain-containing protein n=1 Tax=Cannabis sativa TaxID=3483 RepID=A0A803QK33_CANSA